MTREQKEERAAEFALGTFEDRRCVALELVGDAELAGLVGEWEERLASLAEDIPEETPRESLWTAIAARLDETSLSSGARTIYAEQGRWHRIGEGIEAKILWIDKANGMRSCLLRCAPGARLAAHEHPRDEECLLLEGDLTFGTLTLGPGDYHVIGAGHPHPEGSTRNGCLVFLRGDLHAKVA